MRWMELPQELRDDLDRRRDLNHEVKKAANAEKRRQREITRAIEKQQKRRRAEARRRERPKPMVLASPSRIRVRALAIAERCRELGFLLDDIDGVRPCRRKSQREVIEIAVRLLEASLSRKLVRRKVEKPEWADFIARLLDRKPGSHGKVEVRVSKARANGEVVDGDGDGRIVAADRFRPDTPA